MIQRDTWILFAEPQAVCKGLHWLFYKGALQEAGGSFSLTPTLAVNLPPAGTQSNVSTSCQLVKVFGLDLSKDEA